jgi:conjugative transfer signal peptidase TraF
MKRISAVAMTALKWREGIRINGVPVSGSMKADKAGRAMPHYPSGIYILGKSELLLMSGGSSTSFDSRYFGLVEFSQLKDGIRPVINW